MKLQLNLLIKIIYLNIKCFFILTDKKWYKLQNFKVNIHKIITLIIINNINSNMYFINEYII